MWLPLKPAPPVTTAILRSLISILILFQRQSLHRFHVDERLVPKRVPGEFSLLEGAANVADGTLNSPLRSPTQPLRDLARGDAVRAVVIAGRALDTDGLFLGKFFFDDLLRNFRQLLHRLVLVPGIKNFALCFFLRHREHLDVKLTNVIDMNIWALLIAAKKSRAKFLMPGTRTRR